MAKRPTQLDKAIQDLDDQIAALQLARNYLVLQQQRPIIAKPAKRRGSLVVEKIG